MDAGTLQLAWRHNSGDELITVTAEQGDFTSAVARRSGYAAWQHLETLYLCPLTDNRIAENPYRCTGQSTEEVYCCSVGQEISREQALLQSCGLYFAPERWHIDASDWRQYWQKTTCSGMGDIAERDTASDSGKGVFIINGAIRTARAA